MESTIMKTESAYDYPLLIKTLFYAPIVDNPDQEIVYRGEKRFKYSDFRDRVKRLAAALQKLGVKQGNTVAMMDWDSHRYLECFYAVPMIGAVLHTVNIRLSPEQLIYTIDHAEDDVILVNSDFLPILEQIKGRIDTAKVFVLIVDDPKPAETTIQFVGEYEQLLSESEPLEEFPDFSENTRATTFYTTGTTGMPKGVYFSHRQLVLHTLATGATLASSHVHGSFHRDDVYMPMTPMFHVHAWGIPYIAVMLGVKHVYPGKYIPDLLLKLIETEKVTFSHCVPTILHMLLKSPVSEKADLSHWKVIIGGAALPRALCLDALKRGIDVYAGYGMSETCPVLTISFLGQDEIKLPIEEQAELRVRTGSPIAMVQLKVVDEALKPVNANDRSAGEIVVRSPWLTQGYLKDRFNSEKLWAGGWLHTSDVACVNAKRSVRITDRKKDIIKVGGEWLSSLEIEDMLIRHPEVSEAAVIGKQDLQWGEIPLGLVVLKDGRTANEKEILHYMREFVNKGMLPKEAILLKVQIVPQLYKTSVGKIDKLKLRETYTK